MSEQWKEIKGNREIYKISSLGNVETKDREGGLIFVAKPLWISRKDYDRINESKCVGIAVEAQGRPAMQVYISVGNMLYGTIEHAKDHSENAETIKEIAEDYYPDNESKDLVALSKEE